MANQIKIKRGLNASLPALAEGEPGFTTDDKELWIGGSVGNVKIGPGAAGDRGDTCLVVAANDTPAALKTRADYVCDGVDDQSQINTAFGVAKTVMLCVGTYSISASIVMSDNQSLFGSGQGTILTLVGDSIIGITNEDQIAGNRNITIADLKLHATTVVTQTGIWLWYVSPSSDAKGAIIQRVKTENIHTGIYLRYCYNCLVSHCMFYNGGYSGVVARYNGQHVFSNCIAVGNSDNGLNVTSNACDCIIANCIARNCDDGISIETGCHRTICIGNISFKNRIRGLYLHGGNDCIISGNFFTENSQAQPNYTSDIHIEDSSRCLVQGNSCRAGALTNKPSYGIEIYSGSNNLILDNDLYNDGFGTNSLKNSGTGSIIKDNRGHNPGGIGSISVGVSPFTYTAGASPESVYVSGGTVSAITKGGNDFGLISGTFELEPYESIIVTYSATATMFKDIH